MGLVSSVPEVQLPPQPQPQPISIVAKQGPVMYDKIWKNKFLVECWSSKTSEYTPETEVALAHQSPKLQELILKEAALFDELFGDGPEPNWRRFRP